MQLKHVKGAKHFFFNPNEIPDYRPSKEYNPIQRRQKLNNHFNNQLQSNGQNELKLEDPKKFVSFQSSPFKNKILYKPKFDNQLKPLQHNNHPTRAYKSDPVYHEPIYNQPMLQFHSPASNNSLNSSALGQPIQSLNEYQAQSFYLPHFATPNNTYGHNSLSNSPQMYQGSLHQGNA